MTVFVIIVAFFAATSLVLGIYFRIAEFDVLASDKVWDRIAPASHKIVSDERVPDELAEIVTAFTMLAGCGCFVNGLMMGGVKRSFGFDEKLEKDDLKLKDSIAALDDDTQRLLSNLLQDLLLFDSLHAPILGRISRWLNPEKFKRIDYKTFPADSSDEREFIFRITHEAEATIEKKQQTRPHGSPVAA